jgi:hypothetical protein
MKLANLIVSIVSVSYALASFVMSNAITLTEGMTTESTNISASNISASNISASNISEKMEFLNRVLRWIGWNYMNAKDDEQHYLKLPYCNIWRYFMVKYRNMK